LQHASINHPHAPYLAASVNPHAPNIPGIAASVKEVSCGVHEQGCKVG
jgi:hypothetical protein